MSASEQRAKSSKMAADLKARGIYHGRRMTAPYAHSGGMTFKLNEVGSSKYQRLVESRRGRVVPETSVTVKTWKPGKK